MRLDDLRHKYRKRVLIAVPLGVVVLVGALLFWWYSTLWEKTDDAQIDGHLNPISARVGGNVVRVNFDDNQFVKAGTVLVDIDPTDYRVALERAQAEYAQAIAAERAAQVTVPITSSDATSRLDQAKAAVSNAQSAVLAAQKRLDVARARLKEAEANRTRDQKDLVRYRALLRRGVIPRQQYDAMVAAAASSAATAQAAAATVGGSRAEVNEARGNLTRAAADLRAAQTAPEQISVSRSRADEATAAVKRSKALLDQAKLNLGYTRLSAPVDGIVGRKAVEVGQNIQPGQILLSLVAVNDIWVTANFKETQLRHMRPGQRAAIKVDTYRRSYDGHVESIGGASGARFSLFPPENATGNYVKVVQRIPVRIRLDLGQDREHLLRPGMSVVPKVRIQ